MKINYSEIHVGFSNRMGGGGGGGGQIRYLHVMSDTLYEADLEHC